MIISPPFLPARAAGQADGLWLDAAMREAPLLPQTGAPEGSFPLSLGLAWHNGMHLQASADGIVRCVADGRVVFMQEPVTPSADVNHAQNYNPFDRPGARTPAWTDNGCIIVEHRTSIGAAGTADTEFVYYSLYMHLRGVGLSGAAAAQGGQRRWQAGDAIWRKDAVGDAGQIYGRAGLIHFEIALDPANLQRLLGRAPAWTSAGAAGYPTPTADGRIDSVFGSLYFYLPGSTPIARQAAMPANHLRAASAPGQATLGRTLWVRMTYANGACQFASYDEQGALIAEHAARAEEEYQLFQSASDRHASLPAPQRASSSPSGWYELLRFGRNLGQGNGTDPVPATAAHWRRIPAPDGTAVWADLNAPGSFKFSDADFLPVTGWNVVDDDSSPNDQRCDSVWLIELIRDPDPARADRMQPEALMRRLGDRVVRSKMRRMICRFPSEWDRATIPVRYAFVQREEAFVREPQEWTRLLAHLQSMSFAGLPQGYLGAVWHVHPREFIEHVRKCGWLSGTELTQLMPRRHGNRQSALTVVPWAVASGRFSDYVRDLNRTFRKYLISSPDRQIHFLAQTYIETAMWQTMEEFGRARQQRRRDGTLYWPVATMEYYGAFYGRGIMQLTWAGNYEAYGGFRALPDVGPGHNYADARMTPTSRHYWQDPRDRQGRLVQQPRQWHARFDPADIHQSEFNACDSGGFYWVWKEVGGNAANGDRNRNINRICDLGTDSAAVGRASVLVNGGGFGFAERQAYAAFVSRFRGDSVEPVSNGVLAGNYRGRAFSTYVDYSPQRP
jgi:predicted chitinase